jgi:hypothetical protein
MRCSCLVQGLLIVKMAKWVEEGINNVQDINMVLRNFITSVYSD